MTNYIKKNKVKGQLILVVPLYTVFYFSLLVIFCYANKDKIVSSFAIDLYSQELAVNVNRKIFVV